MNPITIDLNRQIANWTVLHMKLHHYHWFVKGPYFFTLHAKFEELYTEAASHIDSLAERLLAIGEKPVSTLSEMLRIASIKEATGEETAEQMIAWLARDFSLLVEQLKTGIQTAESLEDKVTEDLLVGLQAGLEKQIWMLDAFLHRAFVTSES